MPTLLDTLFFKVGWDTSDFDKGRKNVERDFKGAGESGKKFAGDIESAGKSAASAFRTLRNETVGLFLAFAGASSLKGFVGDLITAAASTDRIAKNIGVTTEKLTAFQMALRENGGTAGDATSAIAAMNNQIQSWKLGIKTGQEGNLQGLGVTSSDFTDGYNVLLKIAEASSRLSRPEFAARAGMLGFSTETIDLLYKGRKAVEAATDAQRENAKKAADAAETAEKFQKVWADIGITLQSAALPYLTKLLNVVNDLVGGISGGSGGSIDPAFGLFVTMLYGIGKAAEYSAKGVLGVANAIRWLRGLPPVTYDDVMSGLGGGGSSMELTDGAKAILSGGKGGGYDGAAAGAANSAYIQSFLTRNGIGGAQAQGITAGIVAEGGSLGMAANGAFGIGQWRGGRQRALFAKYGRAPSLDQQLQFLLGELRGGDAGGPSVLRSGSAAEALRSYIVNFMRPGPGVAGDMRRGMAFLGGGRAPVSARGGGSPTTNIGNITVVTSATDATGIARDLPGKLRQRGLVVQAATGMSQ